MNKDFEIPATRRALEREIEAARVLREQISDLASGDEDFIRDTLEGETSLREIIGALVADDAADAALIDSISAMEGALSARKSRLGQRSGHRRELIASGLDIAGLPKLETPAGTVSVIPTVRKVIVKDESEIPAEFWRPGAPRLDKKALGAALKADRPVTGASLSNGGRTIQIRRS